MNLGVTTENSLTPCFLKQFLETAAAGSLTSESDSGNKTGLKVCSIKAGGMMSLAIDNLGGLWMWGNCPSQSNDNTGEFTLVSSVIPVPVWDFHGHTVVKVACGNEHVVALVSTGETYSGDDLICYSWGNNNHGQLGHGDRESRSHPQVIETFNQECPWAIYEIACGGSHTVTLSKRKAEGDRECRCWTFGLGENGQLGHGTTNSTSTPQPVEGLPQDAELISVDCGLFHTCVVSSSGDVWAWGMQNGCGLCPDVRFSGMEVGDALHPLMIRSGESHGRKFIDPVQVACGAAHTVLASDNGYKLWAWGRGRSGVLGRGDAVDSFIPCVAMWPPLEMDMEKENGSGSVNNREEKVGGFESERVTDLEKRLATATEEVQRLQSKLAVMERYAGILHASVFGKAFQEEDIPSSLRMWGVFNIEKEWESVIESADREKLIRMEAFYRGVLRGAKDMLMKRKIEELVKQCMRS
ncbi:hypothetical protein ACLOJK_040158 [Asimina triloba]